MFDVSRNAKREHPTRRTGVTPGRVLCNRDVTVIQPLCDRRTGVIPGMGVRTNISSQDLQILHHGANGVNGVNGANGKKAL
jgi:hypothetical protein